MNRVFITGESGIDCTCDILDKKRSARHYVGTMFNRTIQMFEYKGLPDTIPQEMLELFLQRRGHACITEVKDNLYAFTGGLGGAPDPYYRPTLYVVANPALDFSASLSIENHLKPFAKQDSQGKCVLVKNDTNYLGLFYLLTRYASELTENDISIRSAQINFRQQTVISAQTDAEIASANEYYKNLEAGKTVAVGEKPFLDGIKVNNVSMQGANTIIQLIELQQYLKASWFNEIGLNANFNMKREYQSEEELQANNDVLLPLIDNMLMCREEAVSAINSTYGTNISVKKNSAWENKQFEVNTAKELSKAEVEATKGEAKEESASVSSDEKGGEQNEKVS